MVHHIGMAGLMWEGPDGALYLVPDDGNLIAIEEANDGGWDLADTPKLPPVKYILPA